MKPSQWFVVATACCLAIGVGCERPASVPAVGPNTAGRVASSEALSSEALSAVAGSTSTDETAEEPADEPPVVVVPLSERTVAERKHRAAEAEWERLLRKRIDVELDDVPLRDALEQLSRLAEAPPISLDTPALKDEGIDEDGTVKIAEKRITLGQALWRILDPLELTWIFQDETLVVTTPVRADERLTTRSHAVGRVFREIRRLQREQSQTTVVRQNIIFPGERDRYDVAGCLTDVLQQETSGPWDDIDGVGGTISHLDDIVTTRQSRSCHDEVAWLLRAIEQYARADFRTGSAAYEPPWVPPADAHALDVALGRPVARVAWNQTPLRDALRTLAADAGLRLYLDRKALDEEGIRIDEPITLAAEGLTLRAVLNRVLRPRDATAFAHHGFLRFTSMGRADEILQTILYDVRDLLEPGRINFGPLIDLIQQETSGPWQDIDGTGGTMSHILNGCLVIRQTGKCHFEIAALLEDLREKRREAAAMIKDPPTNADADGLELKIYPLKSAELATSLAGCFQDLSPESWSARGGKGTIHPVDTALAVRQTKKVHAQIDQFLYDMQRAGVNLGQ